MPIQSRSGLLVLTLLEVLCICNACSSCILITVAHISLLQPHNRKLILTEVPQVTNFVMVTGLLPSDGCRRYKCSKHWDNR